MDEIKEAPVVEEKQVYNISNVPIFRAGHWNGQTYTESDLDDIVSSFNTIGKKIKPYLKLGHSEEQKLLQKDGLPAAGWVTGLKRAGKDLLADFSSMPKKIFDLIQKKAYGRISSELYVNLKEGDTTHKKVLRAVALLGANTPAVTDLDDFINLYTEDNFDYEDIIQCTEYEEDNMDDIKVYESRIEELNSKIEEYELKVSEMEKITAEEKAEFEQKIEKFEQEKIESFTKEVSEYLDRSVKDGKISPAQKPLLEALASQEVRVYSYIEDNQTRTIEDSTYELIKKFIENQPKVEMGEVKSNYQEVDKTPKHEGDIVDDKIRKYMKDNDVDYGTAFSAVAYEGGE